jgi:hypothetical protein
MIARRSAACAGKRGVLPPTPRFPHARNVRVTIAGREVQWTLRDTDETRLATRLEALLARYPAGTGSVSCNLAFVRHVYAAF